MGRIPIVCDTKSCVCTLLRKLYTDSNDTLLSLENIEKVKKLNIIDILMWLDSDSMSRLKIFTKKNRVLINPTCACEIMQLTPVMKKIAGQCAENVVIPYFWDFCGAGVDRSFIYPDLGESGTRAIARAIENDEFDGSYSLARTC